MKQYTTQMYVTKKGIVTPELEVVAKKENMQVEKSIRFVAEGKVVICANKNQTCIDPKTTREICDSRMPEKDHKDTCSMCREFCAVRSMNKTLVGEHIDIL